MSFIKTILYIKKKHTFAGFYLTYLLLLLFFYRFPENEEEIPPIPLLPPQTLHAAALQSPLPLRWEPTHLVLVSSCFRDCLHARIYTNACKVYSLSMSIHWALSAVQVAVKGVCDSWQQRESRGLGARGINLTNDGECFITRSVCAMDCLGFRRKELVKRVWERGCFWLLFN